MVLMYLFLKRLCNIGEPALVGLNSTYTMVVVLVDGSRGDGTEGSRNGGSERLEGVLAILPSVILRDTPEPLDKVQLAMKLGVKNYRVTRCLNIFLKLPLLGLEIRL